MKKLRNIRYLLGTAIFIHGVIFTSLSATVFPSSKPLVLSHDNVTARPLPKLVSRKQTGKEAQQVLQRYIQMHSVRQLEFECPEYGHEHFVLETDCPDLARRRFAVGFYACPQQAGNRLHHFMSTMAWAITTNRTVLWRYYDYETCHEVGKDYDSRICSSMGTRESCEKVLQLASWIPSYDDWSFASGKWMEVSFWSTHYPPAKNETRRKHPWHEEDVKHVGIDMDERRNLDFGQLLGQDYRDLYSKKTRDYLLYTDNARNIASRLLGDDNIMLAGDLLYGMLFHAAFKFSDSLFVSVDTTLTLDDETTIAIHSRHSKNSDNGSNVDREIKCLQKMLLRASRPCRVYAISDRPRALMGILDAATEMGCAVSITNHSNFGLGQSFSLEHGPYAGAGLFLDLLLASKARHGLIGTRRSSTMLLAELIAFDKVNEGMNSGSEGSYVFCDYEKECDCSTVVGNRKWL